MSLRILKIDVQLILILSLLSSFSLLFLFFSLSLSVPLSPCLFLYLSFLLLDTSRKICGLNEIISATTCPHLSKIISIYIYCSSIIINSAALYSQKCLNLDDQDYDHPINNICFCRNWNRNRKKILICLSITGRNFRQESAFH